MIKKNVQCPYCESRKTSSGHVLLASIGAVLCIIGLILWPLAILGSILFILAILLSIVDLIKGGKRQRFCQDCKKSRRA